MEVQTKSDCWELRLNAKVEAYTRARGQRKVKEEKEEKEEGVTRGDTKT